MKAQKTNWLYGDFDEELLGQLESNLDHLLTQADLEASQLNFVEIQNLDALWAFLPHLKTYMAFGVRKFQTLSGVHFDLGLANGQACFAPLTLNLSSEDREYPRLQVLHALYQHLDPLNFWPDQTSGGEDHWGKQDFPFTRPENIRFLAFNSVLALQMLASGLLEIAQVERWSITDPNDPQAQQWVEVAQAMLDVLAPETVVYSPLGFYDENSRYEFFLTWDRLFPSPYYNVYSFFVLDRKTKEVTLLAFAR